MLANILLCLWTAASGNVAFAAQEVPLTTDERGVPGTPVTNESVEAGLRKNREALRNAPQFQTNDALTHLRLAEVLGHQGDPNGAIEEYQAAIELNPGMAEAYRGMGAVYIDKHEWEKSGTGFTDEHAIGRSNITSPSIGWDDRSWLKTTSSKLMKPLKRPPS